MEEELAKKTAELEALQKSFDEFLESSKDLEQELEQSLEDANKRLAASEARKEELEHSTADLQKRLAALQKQVLDHERDLQVVRERLTSVESTKRQLEVDNDDLASKVRLLESSADTAGDKLMKAVEDAVLAKEELDLLREKHKEEILALQDEIGFLKSTMNQQQQQPSQSVEAGVKATTSLTVIPPAAIDNSVDKMTTTVADDEHSFQKRLKYTLAHGTVEELRQELLVMSSKYEAMKKSNTQLLYKMQALKGNIQVCCRARPPQDFEVSSGGKVIIDASDDVELLCFDWKSESWRAFTFDRVWNPELNQADVFSDVEPFVLSVVDGYNACIMAYGQTGSGKTFTMEGTQHHLGINYRSILKIFEVLESRKAAYIASHGIVVKPSPRVSEVNSPALGRRKSSSKFQPGADSAFRRLFSKETAAALASGGDSVNTADESSGVTSQVEEEDDSDEGFHYTIEMSMLEIYNEQVFDLLWDGYGSHSANAQQSGQSSEAPPLDVRQAPDGSVSVPGLKQVAVHSIAEVIEVFQRGSRSRATASTNLNEHSSRSHLIVQVDVSVQTPGSSLQRGRLYLVDLAGSERVNKSGVTGTTMREAQYINKSLLALGDVMEALDQKQKFVPYRNSKLTFLLQNALGGQARTMLVVTLCPTDANLDESLFTLQFATRVRNIQLGAVPRYSNSKNLEVALKNLRIEIKELRKKKQAAEDALLEAKKEAKRVSEKNVAPLEQRVKLLEDGKKAAELLAHQLSKQLQEVSQKAGEEKHRHESVSADIEMTHKNLKRALDQIKELKVENEHLDAQLRSKTRELESVQAALLRNMQSTSSQPPQQPHYSSGAGSGDVVMQTPARASSSAANSNGHSRVTFSLEDGASPFRSNTAPSKTPPTAAHEPQPLVTRSAGPKPSNNNNTKGSALRAPRRESFPLSSSSSSAQRTPPPQQTTTSIIRQPSKLPPPPPPAASDPGVNHHKPRTPSAPPSASAQRTSTPPLARHPNPLLSTASSSTSSPLRKSRIPQMLHTPSAASSSQSPQAESGGRSLTPTYVPFQRRETAEDAVVIRDAPSSHSNTLRLSSSSLPVPTASKRLVALNARTEDALRRHQERMNKKREQAQS